MFSEPSRILPYSTLLRKRGLKRMTFSLVQVDEITFNINCFCHLRCRFSDRSSKSAVDFSRTLCEYCDPSLGPHAPPNFLTLPWKPPVLQDVTKSVHKVKIFSIQSQLNIYTCLKHQADGKQIKTKPK